MKFLAESINLLDLDSASRPYVTSSTPNDYVETTHSPSNERSSTNSCLFGWFNDGQTAVDNDDNDREDVKNGNEEDGDHGTLLLNETKDSNHCKSPYAPQEVIVPPSPRSCEDDEFELFLFHDNNNSNNNNDDSFTSLLSSLSPDTPLTLSASDLNRSQNIYNYNEQEDDEDATLTRNNNTFTTTKATSSVVAVTDTILTKTITHRLSSQGCFSGNIDTLTGHPKISPPRREKELEYNIQDVQSSFSASYDKDCEQEDVIELGPSSSDDNNSVSNDSESGSGKDSDEEDLIETRIII